LLLTAAHCSIVAHCYIVARLLEQLLAAILLGWLPRSCQLFGYSRRCSLLCCCSLLLSAAHFTPAHFFLSTHSLH
jgi:hypothetical protein